jgi:putative endonuclease
MMVIMNGATALSNTATDSRRESKVSRQGVHFEIANAMIETWFVYVLECAGGKLYTGITNNLEARFEKHASGKGAIYTRLNPPIRFLAYEAYPSKSDAAKVEYRIKQLPRAGKLEWVNAHAGSLTFAR